MLSQKKTSEKKHGETRNWSISFILNLRKKKTSAHAQCLRGKLENGKRIIWGVLCFPTWTWDLVMQDIHQMLFEEWLQRLLITAILPVSYWVLSGNFEGIASSFPPLFLPFHQVEFSHRKNPNVGNWAVKTIWVIVKEWLLITPGFTNPG